MDQYAQLQALLGQLPPEALESLTGAGTLDSQNAQLEKQMAMAQALRSNHAGQHHTPMGALFGGLSDGLNTVNANLQQQRLQGQLDSNNAAQGASIKALIAALRGPPGSAAQGLGGDMGAAPQGPASQGIPQFLRQAQPEDANAQGLPFSLGLGGY